MRLMIALTVFVLGAFGTAQAQSIDCGKLLSNCTGPSSAKSPLSCMKKAPAPIQRACASVIAKYNLCASRCDKGARGSLCRSKCSSSVKTATQKKSLPRGMSPKKPVVKKSSSTVKRPSKNIRPMAKPKTGKYQGKKKASVKRPSKNIRPIAKSKTGKYQGKKKASVKRPSKNIRPIAKPKTGKYQGTQKPSVKHSGRAVRKVPVMKSKKSLPSKKTTTFKKSTSKSAGQKPSGPVSSPARKVQKKQIFNRSAAKSKAVRQDGESNQLEKSPKVKSKLPVKKASPRFNPKRTADTTAPAKRPKPTAKSLRSKSNRLRGLKPQSNAKSLKASLKTKSSKNGSSSTRPQKKVNKNVARCKKDSKGRLVCKPVSK